MTTAFRPSTPTVPATTSDQLLDGRYRLLERLGSGGAADVWRAHDTRLERAVAIKIFRPGATDPGRERAEAEVMARCSHSGLVTVFDAGRLESGYEAPRSYLVMEVVEGSTLRDRLRSGRLPVATVAAIGAQVSGALAYVHAQGVVHRDVKPANLLVADARNGADGGRPTVKLADFGVARMLGGEPLTEVGTTVGTANYVSPEQIRGKSVGPASDVYSLGLVLLEALTAQMVYPGRGVEAALARLERRPEIPAGIGPDLADLLTSMTADDPEARPSAATVAARLSGAAAVPGDADAVTTAFAPLVALGRRSVDRPAPIAVGEAEGRRPRRGVLLAAAATVAALLGGVGLAVSSGADEPAPARSAPTSPAAVWKAPAASHRPAAQAPTQAPAATAQQVAAAQQAQTITMPTPKTHHLAPIRIRPHGAAPHGGHHQGKGGGDHQGD